jgi:hypothetical protein
MILDNKRYGERGEEFKGFHYASAAATRDRNLWQFAGNLWQTAGTIPSRRYSLPTPTIGLLLVNIWSFSFL